MKNEKAVYMLADAANRAIILLGYQLRVMLFVQRNVLDTRFYAVSERSWEQKFAAKMKNGAPFHSFNSFEVQDLTEVSPVVSAKMKQASILARGYVHLLWFANSTTEGYWSTASLDYDDLPLYYRNPDLFVDQYVASKQVTRAHAVKQLTFDAETLASIAVRRKQILWDYEQSLVLIQTEEELEAWKLRVYSDTINVGSL